MNDEPIAWVLAWLSAKTRGVALLVAAVGAAGVCVYQSGYQSLLPFVPVTVLAGLFVLAGWAIQRRLESQPEPAPD
jgi:hypothetical protein